MTIERAGMIQNTEIIGMPNPICKMNLSELILQIGLMSMSVLQGQLEEAYNKVADNNQFIKQANKAIEALRNRTTKDPDTKKDVNQKLEDIKFKDPDSGKEFTLKEFLDTHGITYKNNPPGNAEEWKNLEDAIGSASDARGGMNQIDSMKLQQTLNKTQEMSQLVSNNISKLNQTTMALIGNMR